MKPAAEGAKQGRLHGTRNRPARSFPPARPGTPNALTQKIRRPVSLVVLSQGIRLTEPIEQRLERGKDGSGQTDNRPQRDGDVTPCALRPIWHGDPRHETPDELPAF